MTNKNISTPHPYIPNTVPEVKQKMLKTIGVKSIEELFNGIPQHLQYNQKLNIPDSLSEHELRRHVNNLMNKNISTDEVISFLGGGSWQHFIPSVCNEVNQRAEFLTAYTGDPYEDHGRYQALFEYQSLMAELVDMDVVNIPTFDWAQAAATSIRMSARITGKSEVLLPKIICPEKLKIIKNYCSPDITYKLVDYCSKTGSIDLKDLKSKITSNTAAIYFENPSYLGFLETSGEKISKMAKDNKIITIVGVDPSSLGIMTPPGEYGADIVCGDLQPLGIPMSYGGGQAGFIATRNELEYIQEFPSRLIGISPTSQEGEYGFGEVLHGRTSLQNREKGKEFVGTQASLWAITAGVYLSLMGPKGMHELGQTIMQKSQYTIKELQKIDSIKANYFENVNFKEFIVDFNETGKTVKEINKKLRDNGVFGGIDLSDTFPEFGQCALYCVTEVHSKKDIDTLIKLIKEL